MLESALFISEVYSLNGDIIYAQPPHPCAWHSTGTTSGHQSGLLSDYPVTGRFRSHRKQASISLPPESQKDSSATTCVFRMCHPLCYPSYNSTLHTSSRNSCHVVDDQIETQREVICPKSWCYEVAELRFEPRSVQL